MHLMGYPAYLHTVCKFTPGKLWHIHMHLAEKPPYAPAYQIDMVLKAGWLEEYVLTEQSWAKF